MLAAAGLVVVLVLSPPVQSRDPDADWLRLQAELSRLDADPELAQAGGLERLKARQSLDALTNARSKDRASALQVAEWRVEAARLAAEAEPLEVLVRQLDSDRDAILVEASQREAQRARREAELSRLQALAREEEIERQAALERRQREQADAQAAAATQEAEQARQLAEAREREAELARQEAELAAQLLATAPPAEDPILARQRRGQRVVFVLAGRAFASGQAQLSAEARKALSGLAKELAAGKRQLRIEGHTDSQGKPPANQALSLKRARAVAAVLQAGGIAAGRLQASGLGETAPLADNGNPEGRARNRRVEIWLD